MCIYIYIYIYILLSCHKLVSGGRTPANKYEQQKTNQSDRASNRLISVILLTNRSMLFGMSTRMGVVLRRASVASL